MFRAGVEAYAVTQITIKRKWNSFYHVGHAIDQDIETFFVRMFQFHSRVIIRVLINIGPWVPGVGRPSASLLFMRTGFFRSVVAGMNVSSCHKNLFVSELK